MAWEAGKLGKLGPQFPVGLRELAAYAPEPLPPPAAGVDFTTAASSWPMNGNDQYPDSTVAAAAHCLQAWNAEASAPYPVPDEADCVSAYLQLAGDQDAGLVESQLLSHWMSSGLWGTRITGYAPVNVHDVNTLRQCVDLLSGVYGGIQLPANARPQFSEGRPWALARGWQHEPVEGGQAVAILGYDDSWLYAVVWGAVQEMAWDWWHTYADEAWAVLSPELDGPGVVRGIDVDALKADLARL